MLASVASRSLVFALATATPPLGADAAAPTPKEQALMEHACRSVQAGLAHDAYDRCLEARLLSLRADFGPDLSKLSASARGKIDAACSPAQALHGRDDYIDCLSGQLTALSASPARALIAAPAEAPVPAVDTSSLPADASEGAEPGESESTFFTVQTAFGALAGTFVAGALLFLGVRARRARPVCRVCGVNVPASTDMCHACRHNAAEAVRQAANQRAEQRRTAEAEDRRRQDEAEERRLEDLRRAELQQRRRLDEARRAEEETARREELARRDAEERRRAEAAASFDADESVFDPYAALGLPAGAGEDDVRAAYEEAKVKYDPELVADLGYDAKEHFKKKFRAVERAYRMLAEASL